jgi:hypothetical protein
VFPPISKLPIQNPATSKIIHHQMPIPKPLPGSNAGSPTHSLRASPTHSCNVSVAGSLPLSLPSFVPGVEPSSPPTIPLDGMELELSGAVDMDVEDELSRGDAASDGGADAGVTLGLGLPGLSDDLDSIHENEQEHARRGSDAAVSGAGSGTSEGGVAQHTDRQMSREATSSLIGSVRTAVTAPALEPPSRHLSNITSLHGLTNHPNIITDDRKEVVRPLIKQVNPSQRPQAEMFVLQGSSTKLASSDSHTAPPGKVERARSIKGSARSGATPASSRGRGTTISANITAAKPSSPSSLSLQSGLTYSPVDTKDAAATAPPTVTVAALGFMSDSPNADLPSPPFMTNDAGEVVIGNLDMISRAVSPSSVGSANQQTPTAGAGASRPVSLMGSPDLSRQPSASVSIA